VSALRDLRSTAPGRRLTNVGRLAIVAGLALVVAAAVITITVMASAKPTKPAVGQHQSGQIPPGQMPSGPLSKNPNVDPGTSLPGKAAPNFTLTNQFGARVSLRQFRGKAVVLAFVDSRCTSVCPLTTLSMTQAQSMLGPAAAAHIQLIGIDANPDATKVADMRAYSSAHQMLHAWDFLTGNLRQLGAVWRDYHVYVAASHGNIDHEPAIYLIDERGNERTLYLTQMAYASIGQQADLIAQGLSRLLPGHPAPHELVPLALAKAIRPAQAVTVPVIGGADQARNVALGPGHPHLVVFIASWLNEMYNLPAELRVLASYQQQAVRHGWPSVVALDETQTESNAAVLPKLLAAAGGRGLGFPVAADASGRMADGYGVADLPWIEIISPTGRVLFHHDGWLSGPALARAAAAHKG
jgi:cytochrome oxidase Cu insertion factor (SCO1/SenC/PrrC family)